MELFLCYRPCFSPTAVTASVSAHVDGLARPASLVVARGSQLEIYAPTSSGSGATARLRLRASVTLFASLVGLHVVTVSGRQQQVKKAEEATTKAPSEALDLLLLCLAPAKLVLAKFDPRLGRLVPVRLFNLDEGAVGAGAFAHKALLAHRASSASSGDAFFAPLAAVEPPSLKLTNRHHPGEASQERSASNAMAGRGARCAAVLVHGQTLVILPLAHHQASLPKDGAAAPDASSSSSAGAPIDEVEERVPLVSIRSKRSIISRQKDETAMVDDLVEASFDNANVVTTLDADGKTIVRAMEKESILSINGDNGDETGEGGDGDGEVAFDEEANGKVRAFQDDGEKNEIGIEEEGDEGDDIDDDDVSTDDEYDDAFGTGNNKSADLAAGGGSRTTVGGATMNNVGLKAVWSTMGEKTKGGVAAVAQRTNIPAPFTVDLAALGVTGAVRDMCFLAGYSDPTLLILYEDTSSASGAPTGSANDAAEMGGNNSSNRLPFPGGVPKEGRCAVVAVAFDLSGRGTRKHATNDATTSTSSLTSTLSSTDRFSSSQSRAARTAASAAHATAARAVAQAAGVAALRRWCVWHVGGLPFNATKLVAAPLPTSGALVLCRHAVLFVDHTRRGAAATSAFFSSALPASLPSDAGAAAGAEALEETALESADLAQCCFVSPFLALIATPAGRLLSVTLVAPNRLAGSSSGLAALHLRRVAASPLASCLTALNAPPLNGPFNDDPQMQGSLHGSSDNGLANVFMGSRLGDSLLLQCTLQSASNDSNRGLIVPDTIENGSETLSASPDSVGSSSSSSTVKTTLDPAAISKMKVVDLRVLLAKKGLDTSGLKKDLEKRLLAAGGEKNQEYEEAGTIAADPPAKRAKVDAGAVSSQSFEPLIPLASAWNDDGDDGEEDAFLYGHASPLTVVQAPNEGASAATENQGTGTSFSTARASNTTTIIDRGYSKVSGLRVMDVLPGAGPLGKGVLAEGSPGMGRQLGAAQLPRDNLLVQARRADARALQQGEAWEGVEDAGAGGEGNASEDQGEVTMEAENTSPAQNARQLPSPQGDAVMGARELLFCSGVGTESGGIVAVTHGLAQGSFLDPFVPTATSTEGAPWAVPLPSGLFVSGMFALSATRSKNEATTGTSKAGRSTAALVVSGRSLNGSGRTRILAVENDLCGGGNGNENALALSEVRNSETLLRNDVETLALGSLAPSNLDGSNNALLSSCELQVHAQGLHCILHTGAGSKAAPAKVATLAWSFDDALPASAVGSSCVNASFGARCAALLVSSSPNLTNGNGDSSSDTVSDLLIARCCSASSNEPSTSSKLSLLRVGLAPAEPATTALEVTAVSVLDDRAARSSWALYGHFGAKAHASSLFALLPGGKDVDMTAVDIIAVAYKGGSIALHVIPPPPLSSCCNAGDGSYGGVAESQSSVLLVRLPAASFGPSSLMPRIAPVARGAGPWGQYRGMEMDGNIGGGAYALATGVEGSNLAQNVNGNNVDDDDDEGIGVADEDDDDDDEEEEGGGEEESVPPPRVVDLMLLAIDNQGNGLVSSYPGNVPGEEVGNEKEDPERLMLVLATDAGDLCVYVSAELSPCDLDHPTPKAAPITTEDDDDDDAIDDEENDVMDISSNPMERWPRTFNRVPQDIVTRGPVKDTSETSSFEDGTTASPAKPVFSPPVLRLWTLPQSATASMPTSAPSVVLLCLMPSPAVLAAPRGMPLLAPAQHMLRELVTSAASDHASGTSGMAYCSSSCLFAPSLLGCDGQILTAGALIPKPVVNDASPSSSNASATSSSSSPLVLLRPPPHAATTAAAAGTSAPTNTSDVEHAAEGEPLLSSGGCGAGVAMRKVFLGVRTHAVASLSAKGLREFAPLRRNLAQAPKVVVLISKPRPRMPATVAAKGLNTAAAQRAAAVELQRLDSDFPPYATSFAEPSTLPSPFEALPGLEGRTKYAYRTQSTCAASIAATNEMEEDGMDEEQVTFLESSATRASVEGPRSEGMPAVDDEVYEVWVLNGSTWEVLERHPLLPGEKGTCLTTATLKPPLKDANDDTGDEARLYVVVGTAQISDAGEEVLTRGRMLLFEVGDPFSRGADGPLGPALPVDMTVKSASSAPAGARGAAGASAALVAAGSSEGHGEEEEEDSEWVGVGPREKAWLQGTSAAVKGARHCMLVPSCAKYLDGAALQVVQLSNHLAVAFGAGSHGLGGCARVEVFAFSLLDDLDDDDNNEGSAAAAAASSNIASASVHSGSGHGNGATSSSGSQQQQRGHQVSRFQGLPVGGGGFASKGELKTLAFLDTPRVSFVTALQAVGGSYLMVGDLDLSVQLVHWRAKDKSLNLIGNDSSQATGVAAVGAVVDGGKFSVVVSDDTFNLLALDPPRSGRKGGELLRRSADMHLGGGGATSLVPVPLPPATAANSGTASGSGAKPKKRAGLYFGTADGGAGCLLPVDESVFRRLYSLQIVLSNALPHPAATNPRQHRTARSRGRAWATHAADQHPKRSVLDGSLLWRFVSLDVRDQQRLAHAVGTDAALAIDSLRAIDAAAASLSASPK